MAYAALVSLAQTIDLLLNYHQDSISPQIKDQVISIHKHVVFLQEFLENFPEEANSLEARVREVTQAAEDIIEFLSPDEASDRKFNHQTKEECEHFVELERVTKEVELIAEQVTEINNNIKVEDVPFVDSTAPSASSRIIPAHEDDTVGFDNDLMEIKSRLCGESSMLQVVPIAGMGGIGKTTLARTAYDDPLIVEYFMIRAWVTVSQDYSDAQIVSNLLVSVEQLVAKNEPKEEHQGDAKNDPKEEHQGDAKTEPKGGHQGNAKTELKEGHQGKAKRESKKEDRVYKNLKGRRYLIVLDDIWSVKAWDDLKMMFPDDDNGSRIMLTTRLLDVASYVDSFSPIHEMRLMDEDQSWVLLRQKVFKQDPCPLELEHIGKVISRSCRGLPLAIVVISGLLAVNQTENAWRKMANNVISTISANDEQVDQILSLSYAHLPHHLRPFFLYMAGFPEDYEVRASELTRLWVAEGFLKQNVYNKSSEETAEVYLEDLVRRNLVLVTKRKSDGRVKSISMHDIMREMCVRKAREEKFFLLVDRYTREGIQIPCRVSLLHSNLDVLPPSRCHTIILFKHGSVPQHLGYFSLLRILDLSNTWNDFHGNFWSNPYNFPTEVCKLFHLRYLALRDCDGIPAAISRLENLQTLIIGQKRTRRRESVQLPDEIWRMPRLRHLIICYCHLRVSTFSESAAFALENLQTLYGAINFTCTPRILKMIPNLKKLGLCYSIEKNTYVGYQLHSLVYLQRLEILKLKVQEYPHPRRVYPAFPRTLKKLSLSGCGFPWENMHTVGSLPNLEVLKLRNRSCIGHTWETTEGEFCELRFLLISEPELQHWVTESSHFPRLNCLVLRGCSQLKEIPDDVGEIPTLELIEVDSHLINSARRIQDEQQSCGNDALQVRYVRG